jgi:adenylate cyclase
VGNFGGNRFFDYTAHGDTMNAAARLEAANKRLGTRICVSSAASQIAGAFYSRPIGDLLLRGRSEPLRAHELLSASTFDATATAKYMDAYNKLEAEDASAIAAFAIVVASRPNDALAEFHLRRLLNGAKGVRIDMGP